MSNLQYLLIVSTISIVLGSNDTTNTSNLLNTSSNVNNNNDLFITNVTTIENLTTESVTEHATTELTTIIVENSTLPTDTEIIKQTEPSTGTTTIIDHDTTLTETTTIVNQNITEPAISITTDTITSTTPVIDQTNFTMSPETLPTTVTELVVTDTTIKTPSTQLIENSTSTLKSSMTETTTVALTPIPTSTETITVTLTSIPTSTETTTAVALTSIPTSTETTTSTLKPSIVETDTLKSLLIETTNITIEPSSTTTTENIGDNIVTVDKSVNVNEIVTTPPTIERLIIRNESLLMSKGPVLVTSTQQPNISLDQQTKLINHAIRTTIQQLNLFCVEHDVSCDGVYDLFRLQVNKRASNETTTFFDFSNIDWNGPTTISALVLIVSKVLVFVVSFVIAKVHYSVKRTRNKEKAYNLKNIELQETKPLMLNLQNSKLFNNSRNENDDDDDNDIETGNPLLNNKVYKPTTHIRRHDSRTLSLSRNCN